MILFRYLITILIVGLLQNAQAKSAIYKNKHLYDLLFIIRHTNIYAYKIALVSVKFFMFAGAHIEKVKVGQIIVFGLMGYRSIIKEAGLLVP